MGPWGREAQKSLDTVTIPHDHVIGCNHLQWTGRNSADWELCGAGVGFTGRIHLHWHCLDKVKAAIMAIVKGYSWGLFDCLFLIGHNWTLNSISLSIRSQVTLEISVYNPLSRQFVFCWSSHVLLKNLLLLYVRVCMCVEVRGQLYVVSNLFPSLYGSIWRANSDVHGNGQPRLQVLKERIVNCLYFGIFFFILRRGGEKYLRWLPVVVEDEEPRDGYIQNDLEQMVPWYRCGRCFLVLTIFMASSETWQPEWEVEVCVEAQCHWGGQSTKDSTELNSPPRKPLLPQRVRLSKFFCLSLWWRCHLETDLFPHFLMLYLEIIAYLQGCGKNSTESLIQFPPSFPMVATWTTPLQFKKKKPAN